MQAMTHPDKQSAPLGTVLSLLPFIVVSVVLAALPLLALAEEIPPNDHHQTCDNFHGGPMQHGGFPPPGMGMLAPFALDRLDLSEAQQDKIFELKHAEEPAVFEKEKIARKSMQELQQLTKSDHFDAAKAKSLADAHGKAVAELAYLHAETQAKILAILSDTQRKQLSEEKSQQPRR